ncbi:MAG: type II secretion system protein GspI, partial [Rhodospirillaceae bacterium]
MRLSSKFSQREGFTLVEVLVSLAIVAVVSVSILGAITSILANATDYSEQTQVDLLARALA